MNLKLVLFFGWLFSYNLTLAQSFTFADTHPVNNPDSLKHWLKTNPKAPALVQLRNLIVLERTYIWVNKNRTGTSFPTILQLIKTTKNPTAQAAYSYLLAEKYNAQNQRYQATRYGNQALKLFQKLTDTSGLIHIYCLLGHTQLYRFGGSITKDRTFLTEYARLADQLCRTTNNPHDLITLYFLQYRVLYQHADTQLVDNLINKALALINKQSTCGYARSIFQRAKAVTYYLKDDFLSSFRLNREFTLHYNPNQLAELASAYFNLGGDCDALNRLDEAIAYYKKSIVFARQCSPPNNELLLAAYSNLGSLYAKKGDFRNAYSVSFTHKDSLWAFYNLVNNTQMLDLQARYAFDRQQQELTLLKEKEAITYLQNKFYTSALVAGFIVMLLIGFFAWRLYRTRDKLQQVNTQLKTTLAEMQQLNKTREHFIGIIAHDMRKPLISFRGLAALISTLLKQKAYQDIQQVSQVIDSAGHDIETMFDNLLKWALAQREAIPYHPELLPIAPTLQKVVSLFQQLTQFQQTTILLHCPDSLLVWADPDGLELIVRNLIDNALKQIDTGGQIELVCEQVNQTIQIRMTDTGSGIDVAKLAFLQSVLSGQVKGEVGQNGLGMGLLLVRDFTTRNQGTVTLTSVAGQGSSFLLSLPVGQSATVLARQEVML